MTHIKPTPEAEKLTAEDEATWRQRAASGERKIVGRNFYRRLFATLDASRAETEAVRRERDNRKMAADAWEAIAEEGIAIRTAECNALRSLAAELVEGLKEARDDVESWSGYAMDYFKEKHNLAGDLERIDALIARAHAQGIGTKEKDNG